MPVKPNREYRAGSGFELGAQEENNLILRGVPVVFDTPTCLFECDGVKYYEQIARGAFDGCDFTDFIFNYNHAGTVFARNRNNTLEYVIENNAFNITAHLLPDDERHKQLYRDIETGLIDKMSFSFMVAEQSYDVDTHTRTVLKIKKLYDVSAVDIPAYNDTSISARGAMPEEFREAFDALEHERRRKIAIAKTYF